MESCRICMGNTDVEVDLFTNQPMYHMEMTLLDMINEIVDLNIQCDKLPRKICTTCVSDAQVAFRFKRNCERSYNVFKALISDEGSDDGGEANSDAPHNHTDFLDGNERNPSSYNTDIIKTEPSLELYVVNEMVNDAPDWENDFVEDKQRDLSLQDRNVIVKMERSLMEEDDVINISEDEDATKAYILHRRIQNENESKEKLLALPDFRETLSTGLVTYKNKTLPGRRINTRSASSRRWANQSPSSQSGRIINSPSLQTERAKQSPLSHRPYQHELKHGQKSKHPISDLRFDQLNHFPHWLDRNSGKRWCKHCKTSQTQCICTKCNLHLCCTANKNCFVEYHKKK